MKKKKHVCLLIDFIKSDYYWAYDEMMKRLCPLLLTPQQNQRIVERLEFRPDLPRGTKKLIYMEIAWLLQSGDCVLRSRFCKNDLLRWLSDSNHSNLGASFQTIQDTVNKELRSDI